MTSVQLRKSIQLHKLTQYCVLGFLFLLISCKEEPKPQLFTYKGETMGTTYTIKYVALNDRNEELKKETDTLLAKLNKVLSTYDENSELSLLNKNEKVERKIRLSEDLFIPLENAFKLATKTGGVFDPTIGPLVNLWGFGPDKNRKVPTQKQIEQARARVGYKNLFLDPMDFTVLKTRPDIYIDLSATAKGYGVDKVAALLEKKGIGQLMVEIGGELRTKGSKLGDPWKIAIETPHPDVLNKTIEKIIDVSDMAMATSGNYRNYFEQKGKRYAHTMDFKTGRPVPWIMASVTVLDKDSCMNADSWATALMALGPEKGLEIAEKYHVAAYFIYNPTGKEQDKFVEKKTSSFDKMLGVEEKSDGSSDH